MGLERHRWTAEADSTTTARAIGWFEIVSVVGEAAGSGASAGVPISGCTLVCMSVDATEFIGGCKTARAPVVSR